MTKQQFKQKARRMFLGANPTATIGETVFESRLHRTPTGKLARTWIFRAAAPGYRSREVLATWAEHVGMGVR